MDEITPNRTFFVAIAILILQGAVAAQQPQIDTVVNAASYAASPYDTPAEGSIATIFGKNLAGSTASASTTPLPRRLANVSVLVEGKAVPLYYVSPSQINFQVPSSDTSSAPAVGPFANWKISVQNSSGVSQEVAIPISGIQPGIFTLDGSGCGMGAILNFTAAGQASVNAPDNSVQPGEFVSLFMTGLGRAYWPPPDGEPAQSDPLSKAWAQPLVRLGVPELAWSGLGQSARVSFAGRAPGLVGVDQVNARIPDDAPEGCAVPVTVVSFPFHSQPVTMSIRRGGGRCTDSAISRSGSISARWVHVYGPESSAVSESIELQASFDEVPSSLVPDKLAVPVIDQWHCNFPVPTLGPSCAIPGIRTVSAGPLTISLPGIDSVLLTPQAGANGPVYSASLPLSTAAAGALAAASPGSDPIGGFAASIRVPGHVVTTNPPQPGTAIPSTRPFRMTWSGGTSDMRVRMRVLSKIGYSAGGCEATTTGDVGFLELPVYPFSGNRLPVLPGDDVEVRITVTPANGGQSFAAPGLTNGGVLKWSEEFVFQGLKIQ